MRTTVNTRYQYEKEWRENNREKCKEYTKQYRQKNPNKDKEYRLKNKKTEAERVSKWYQENKEKAKQRSDKWRNNNKEKEQQQKIKYRKNNQEKLAIQEKAWRQKNKRKVYEYQITRMKKIGNPYDLSIWGYKMSLKSWSDMIKDDNNYLCQICFKQAEHTHHIFHKVKYPELSLNPNNGISLCKKCHDEAHGKQLIIRT